MFNILNILLLSEEQYVANKKIIPELAEPWWLNSPGYTRYHVCSVNKKGEIDRGYLYHIANELGVRPVLRIETYEKLKPGQKVELLDLTWTVIQNVVTDSETDEIIEEEAQDNKVLVLCDNIIRHYKFAETRNDWKRSKIKVFLEKWLVYKTQSK